MRFTKMHGTENDYVYVNCFEEQVRDAAALSRAIANRYTGVGGDGLILICPSDLGAVRMEMYNADGSRAQMCGNGIRCVAKYAYEHGLSGGSASIAIETDSGVKRAECEVLDGQVRAVTIDMGSPRFAPSDLPALMDGAELIDAPIAINGKVYQFTGVSMGNPHAVVFVSDLATIDLPVDGPKLESHELFPEKVNAHFVQVESAERVRVLTWERGSGPTRACGTGVSAVCVAGVRTERTGRRIIAEVPGGELELRWGDDDHVYMTGPAVEVFTGTWPD
jgi:diaminopimelate epimerase